MVFEIFAVPALAGAFVAALRLIYHFRNLPSGVQRTGTGASIPGPDHSQAQRTTYVQAVTKPAVLWDAFIWWLAGMCITAAINVGRLNLQAIYAFRAEFAPRSEAEQFVATLQGEPLFELFDHKITQISREMEDISRGRMRLNRRASLEAWETPDELRRRKRHHIPNFLHRGA